jgi:hypothetical protein
MINLLVGVENQEEMVMFLKENILMEELLEKVF